MRLVIDDNEGMVNEMRDSKTKEATMANTYTLIIMAGTKVLRDDSRVVGVIADCYADNAVRLHDGSYRYRLGAHEYIAAAGTVRAIAA